MDTETSNALEALQSEMRRSGSSLRSDIGELRVDMSSMRNELKRHMEVLVESLRDDIRVIAEGVVSLDAKVESIRRNNDLR
jgi:hypothetical protein